MVKYLQLKFTSWEKENMPQITAGLYQLLLHQTIGANSLLSNFWYTQTVGENDKANELSLAFNSNILPTLALAQHTNVDYIDIEVKAIFGAALEVHLTPGTANGALVGTSLPAMMAASIQLQRSSTELRSGWKRISGITEEVVDSPGFEAAYMTTLDSVAVVLKGQVAFGGSTFTPVIVRRPLTTIDQEDFYRQIPVGNAVALDRVTTQNSRKTF